MFDSMVGFPQNAVSIGADDSLDISFHDRSLPFMVGE